MHETLGSMVNFLLLIIMTLTQGLTFRQTTFVLLPITIGQELLMPIVKAFILRSGVQPCFVQLGTTSLGAILTFGISYSVAFQKMQLFLEFKKYYSSSQTVTAMIDKCSDGIMVYTWSSEDKD